MSDTKKVLEKLLEDHVGRHNAITQSQLSDALGMNTSTLRSELRRLREERNIPIGNLRDGYYIISTKEELQEFVGHKNKEIQSKRRTIEYTLEAYEQNADRIASDGGQQIIEETYTCAICESDVSKNKARWPKGGKYDGEVLCMSDYGRLVMEGQV